MDPKGLLAAIAKRGVQERDQLRLLRVRCTCGTTILEAFSVNIPGSVEVPRPNTGPGHPGAAHFEQVLIATSQRKARSSAALRAATVAVGADLPADHRPRTAQWIDEEPVGFTPSCCVTGTLIATAVVADWIASGRRTITATPNGAGWTFDTPTA